MWSQLARGGDRGASPGALIGWPRFRVARMAAEEAVPPGVRVTGNRTNHKKDKDKET
ncbi:hypothetical protein AAIA72_01645 [Hahella sp. SMD15-11]|uniref:Uncharacterized protein n=1 Tax=Thermohahella caldifontis TaxID=3142973 RepID=A0AB39UWK3_9GAMM